MPQRKPSRVYRPSPAFCSSCGADNIKWSDIESAAACGECGHVSYMNSKPSACAVISDREGRVLLVREHGETSWDFPGGFLLYGEDPREGLQRELWEELSVRSTIGELIDVQVDEYGVKGELSLNIFFSATLHSHTWVFKHEVVDACWFRKEERPHLKYRSTKAVLEELWSARRQQR